MENLKNELCKLSEIAKGRGFKVSQTKFPSGTIYFELKANNLQYGCYFWGYDEFCQNPGTLEDLKNYLTAKE